MFPPSSAYALLVRSKMYSYGDTKENTIRFFGMQYSNEYDVFVYRYCMLSWKTVGYSSPSGAYSIFHSRGWGLIGYVKFKTNLNEYC